LVSFFLSVLYLFLRPHSPLILDGMSVIKSYYIIISPSLSPSLFLLFSFPFRVLLRSSEIQNTNINTKPPFSVSSFHCVVFLTLVSYYADLPEGHPHYILYIKLECFLFGIFLFVQTFYKLLLFFLSSISISIPFLKSQPTRVYL
jgi:hypothetical protein